MSTPVLLADFAESLGGEREFFELLPTHDRLHPQLVFWLCWLDRLGHQAARAGLGEAVAIVAGENADLLEHLRAAETNLAGRARFTRVQQNLIQKHVGAARAALERVLQQRLQDLTPRLPLADAAEDALSLFDYFYELGVENAATCASALLQVARGHSLEHKAEPLIQPH